MKNLYVKFNNGLRFALRPTTRANGKGTYLAVRPQDRATVGRFGINVDSKTPITLPTGKFTVEDESGTAITSGTLKKGTTQMSNKAMVSGISDSFEYEGEQVKLHVHRLSLPHATRMNVLVRSAKETERGNATSVDALA